MPRGKIWTINEKIEFIKDFPQMNFNSLCKKYRRTRNALEKYAGLLGVKRNTLQSYRITVTDANGNVIYNYNLPLSNTSVLMKKRLLNMLNRLNNRAIDRGEWILSITHNLECFENEQ